MPLITVESIEDPRLDPYRDLPQQNLTALSGRFIVEGRLLVERLVASRYAVDSVVCDEHRLNFVPPHLSHDVPIFVLPPCGVERLIGFNFHRGILACGRRAPLATAADLVPKLGKNALGVACIDVQDPTNLGGILRNCAAFGVDGVLLSRGCADPFSRRVLRVSMGTTFTLQVASCDNLPAVLAELGRSARVELVATVLDSTAEPLETAQRAPRTILLIGNEAHGLSAEWIAACDRRVTLPMQHGTDSLNASAACAVFLYHFARVAKLK